MFERKFSVVNKKVSLSSFIKKSTELKNYETHHEIDVIVKLINNEVIATKSILKIVENPNLSYPHNIKIKDQFLRELNLKLSTIFNTSDDPIIVKKSKTDARIKEYCFKDVFNGIVKRLSISV